MPQGLEYNSPWVENRAAAAGLGNDLNQVAYGLAQQNYNNNYRQQALQLQYQKMLVEQAFQKEHADLFRAQAASENAKTVLDTQKTKDLQKVAQSSGMLGDVLEHLNGLDPQSMAAQSLQGIAMGQAGQLAGMGNQHAPVNLAQMLQMRDPRMQQMMATGTKMTGSVGAGGTMVDNYGGNPLFQSPRTLTPGSVMVPGAGGAPIAQGAPPNSTMNLGQLFGPLVQLRGQGMNSGIPIDPNNPTFHQTDQVIQQLLPILLQKGVGTNQPPSGATQTTGTLSREQAAQFLKQAGGDKNKARQMAREAGFQF